MGRKQEYFPVVDRTRDHLSYLLKSITFLVGGDYLTEFLLGFEQVLEP